MNFILSIRNKVSILLVFLFFLSFPLIDAGSTVSYLSFEIIALLYLRDFIAYKQYKDVFFKYYSLVLVWAIVVTLLSVDRHRSFISLRFWVIPLIVYIAIVNMNIKRLFSYYVWIPTILLLCENIVLFIFWSKFSYLFVEYPVLKQVMVGFGDWFVKIYTSTVVLCILIGVYFFIKPSKNRNILLAVNFISAFLSYDRAFWFSLLLILLIYLMIEKFKLSIINLCKYLVVLIVSLLILAFIMQFIGMDLHYKERFATYSYWLSVVHVSPIYGIGVGRDSLHYYATSYPVPEYIMKINPFTPFTSHNFFLDLLVTQGAVGVILFLMLLYKINVYAIKTNINAEHRYVTLYMTIAIFSKFLVDNQFDNRKIFIFWFFILMGYLCTKQEKYSIAP